MRIIRKHLPGGLIAEPLVRNAPKAVLRFDQRRRSRQRITLNTGETVGLMLHQGTILHHGDLLIAEDGGFIEVQAAIESVLRVTAKGPLALTRAAYHLGNRHVLVEVGAHSLQLEPDPVLVEMLGQLGDVMVETVQAPFEPDTGAYGKGHKHGHDETFVEDYALAQAAYAAHEHTHGHGHTHEHR